MVTVAGGPTGYRCRCGAEHSFPAYAYAHWDEALGHGCDRCGRANVLLEGKVLDGPELTNGRTVPDLWSATHAPDALGVRRPK